LKVKDYFLTQESFELKKETETGILYTTPTPTDLDKYYQSENYISHTDGNKSLFEKLYQIAKNFNLKSKLNVVKKNTSGKSILDYGCGVGDFLLFMQKNGYNVKGFEPNEDALKIAHKKLGESVSNQNILENTEKYDIITLWHVLEHIPNRDEILHSLIEHLKPNGKLIIAVPNHESFDAKHYKEYWAAYDVPRHLWHFNPKIMKHYSERFGMKIENIVPQYLDSFYVSILSEKYQKNSFPLIRGLWYGLISNLKATKTNQYSSLIYIMEKQVK